MQVFIEFLSFHVAQFHFILHTYALHFTSYIKFIFSAGGENKSDTRNRLQFYLLVEVIQLKGKFLQYG